MSASLRSFIGSILLVVLMGVYALVAVTIATYRLADAGGFVHLAFFAVTGILWIIPAMFLVSWMLKRPKSTKS